MGYFVDQFGRTMYQPDPVPMDNLSQLRAQRQIPQFPQPMQNTQTFPPAPTQPQANQSWAYVQGEAAAKSWFVGNGQSVLLMDSENPVFYIKSADASGVPLPLKIYDYKERVQNTPLNTPAAPQAAPEDLDSRFVTRKEYDDLQGKYMQILERLNNFPAPDSNTEPVRRAEKTNNNTRTKGGNVSE